jgi:peptidoglycan/LPS O-acetylase OafA/YrhL
LNKSIQKYDFIDTLRGLAILLVIMLHVYWWTTPKDPYLVLVASNGALGVQLFFIASALTIFLSLNSRQSKEACPTRNFFIRRFFRIAPMFYLAILAYILINGMGPSPDTPVDISWWFILLTATFQHGWLPYTTNSVVPGGWSIAVEFTFYLLTPLLFRKIKTIRSALLAIALSIPLGWALNNLSSTFFKAIYPQSYIHVIKVYAIQNFYLNLPVFAVGVLVYLLFQKYKDLQDRRLGYYLLTIAVILMIAFLQVSTYQNLLSVYFLASVAFGFLVFGLYFSKSRFLCNPVIRWIGKLSFSMYLVHFMVMHVLTSLFPKGLMGGGSRAFLLAYSLVLVITVILSFATYFLIEKPGIALGKRIIERLEMKNSPVKVESESIP